MMLLFPGVQPHLSPRERPARLGPALSGLARAAIWKARTGSNSTRADVLAQAYGVEGTEHGAVPAVQGVRPRRGGRAASDFGRCASRRSASSRRLQLGTAD